MKIWVIIYATLLDRNCQTGSGIYSTIYSLRQSIYGQTVGRVLRERARNALHELFADREVPELLHDDIRELSEGNYRIVFQVFADRLVNWPCLKRINVSMKRKS